MSALGGQVARFLGSSAVVFVISTGLPMMLTELGGIDPRRSVAVGLAAAFLASFLLVRGFVFRSTGRPGGEALRFLALSLVWRTVEYCGFWLLHAAGMPYLLALVGVLSISAMAKFLVCRHFIFRPSEPSADSGWP